MEEEDDDDEILKTTDERKWLLSQRLNANLSSILEENADYYNRIMTVTEKSHFKAKEVKPSRLQKSAHVRL